MTHLRRKVGTRFDVGHDTLDREVWDFLWVLERIISQAGWVHIDWMGGNTFKKNNWPGDHWYGVAGVMNVSVELRPPDQDALGPAAEALAAALRRIGAEAITAPSNNSSTNRQTVHFLVGAKR
jgi:hypothetical protein